MSPVALQANGTAPWRFIAQTTAAKRRSANAAAERVTAGETATEAETTARVGRSNGERDAE